MDNPVFMATVKATGENLKVYKLKNGNYYDRENMMTTKPPKATQANKKEFTPDELIIRHKV